MSASQRRNLYSVWANDEFDTLIVVDGTADQCAALMGVARQTFYGFLSRPSEKWTIKKTTRKKGGMTY